MPSVESSLVRSESRGRARVVAASPPTVHDSAGRGAHHPPQLTRHTGSPTLILWKSRIYNVECVVWETQQQPPVCWGGGGHTHTHTGRASLWQTHQCLFKTHRPVARCAEMFFLLHLVQELLPLVSVLGLRSGQSCQDKGKTFHEKKDKLLGKNRCSAVWLTSAGVTEEALLSWESESWQVEWGVMLG